MFSKIKDFLFGKAPEQAPTVVPYKVETAPVAETPVVEAPVVATPAVEAVVTPDTVVIAPEAIVSNLVSDTISTELAPAVETLAKPKKPRAPAKSKSAKSVADKKPRKPKAK